MDGERGHGGTDSRTGRERPRLTRNWAKAWKRGRPPATRRHLLRIARTEPKHDINTQRLGRHSLVSAEGSPNGREATAVLKRGVRRAGRTDRKRGVVVATSGKDCRNLLGKGSQKSWKSLAENLGIDESVKARQSYIDEATMKRK